MKLNRTLIIFVLGIFAANFAQAQLKKRIAVSRFEDRSGSGYAHVGEGVADMLATALVKSGKFIVIERQDLDKVLKEQNLGKSGIVTEQSAAKVGKVLGAELLVIGSVSEFGTSEREIGGNVPMFGAAVKRSTARAVVDLRLVDATSSEVVAAEKEEGSESTTGVSAHYEKIDFRDVSAWDNTDIGKAAREAVDGCVELIAENMAKVPWSGRILKVNADGTVLMKPGSEGNVSVGMEFVVYHEGEDLIDPDTGASLGHEEEKAGKVKVLEDMLKGKACKAKVVEGSGFKVGDVVREK